MSKALRLTTLTYPDKITTTSISIEDTAPRKVEKILNEIQIPKDTGLKLFFNGKDTYYIIYETTKQIDQIPDIEESENGQVTINIIEGEEQNELTRHIFKFKRNENFDTLNIELNGKATYFDVSSGY